MRIETGIDLVDIDRIRRSMERPRFLQRVFSQEERDFLLAKRDPGPSAAGNFAAKEAFSKAMGTGLVGFDLSEVSVLRDNGGKPYLELTGRAQRLAQGWRFSVSISHTDDTACAMVTAYREEDPLDGGEDEKGGVEPCGL